MNRRRIFDSFRQAQDADANADAWMSLAEAAEAVHQAERDTDRDRMSRNLGENQDSLLAFWAHRVAQIGVPVYGSRIMGTRPEIVPEEQMQTGRIRDEATRIEIRKGEPINDFGALQVKRSDLAEALTRVRDEGEPQP